MRGLSVTHAVSSGTAPWGSHTWGLTVRGGHERRARQVAPRCGGAGAGGNAPLALLWAHAGVAHPALRARPALASPAAAQDGGALCASTETSVSVGGASLSGNSAIKARPPCCPPPPA